jgi:hypothetical protein
MDPTSDDDDMRETHDEITRCRRGQLSIFGAGRKTRRTIHVTHAHFHSVPIHCHRHVLRSRLIRYDDSDSEVGHIMGLQYDLSCGLISEK